MKDIVSKEGIIYAGLDETNHGRFPEAFAATFSRVASDYNDTRGLKKFRGSEDVKRVLRMYRRSSRDYTFLVSMRTDAERIAPIDFLGYVTTNLFRGVIEDVDFDKIKLLIDGEQQGMRIQRITDMISSACSIAKRRIEIKCGPKFDLRFPIVNAADAIAYSNKGKTLAQISQDSHFRDFYY